jgi:hypothetical protein
MRYSRLQSVVLAFAAALALGLGLFAPLFTANAQETTGGLQGTIKDQTGAVVPKAKVALSGTALIGNKELVTDTSGYYRFANLPPGSYKIVVEAQGFKTSKREGLTIGVGRLPTVDVTLEVGSSETTVEVTSSAPVLDVTSTENLTNVSSEEIENTPHGITFQSVIQYAPMARNEPLAGYSVNGSGRGGSGGSMPGSSGNGKGYGYSIGGAADSESSYLVEGQDTANNSGGYSKANVPMDFIQEVQMKTSGVSAEYGGALGGVVNVIMKKGANTFHGSLATTYESSGTDANQINAFLRYDPTSSGVNTPLSNLRYDASSQLYQAKPDHFRALQPGVTVGGPILKDRLWFFTGFEPMINSMSRSVDFGTYQDNAGVQYFTQDKQSYYLTGRIDAALTKNIRVFGSWLYQYARMAGASMPTGDPIALQSTFLNTSISRPLTNYSHGLGWSAPNATYNVGADITLTPQLVATTKFGYFFENYHDFGWPTSSPDLVWQTSGVGVADGNGDPLPSALQQSSDTATQPYTGSYTLFNANKHYQFNQDLAFYFKSKNWGTHNLKLGYQLNHLTNSIHQNGNVPYAMLYLPDSDYSNSVLTSYGGDNCATLTDVWGACTGQYGFVTIQDFSTILETPASDWNHAFYVQDSWTVGKGLTLNLGLRIEKESLPAPDNINVPSIDFSWSDKIEPRLGATWDPSGKGKMKIFGSYGVVNDVMKLLLAQTSWGAQAYEDCTYALGPDASGTFAVSDISVVFKDGRACPNGTADTEANFYGGVTPASLIDSTSGVSLIENVSYRPWEPVAPNVKPYRQHEYVAGFDYQLTRNWSFEARYDRRRLDHVIEDAALSDPSWGEIFAVVNPGEGVNKTIDSYATYLGSIGEAYGVEGMSFDTAGFGTCANCPANEKAIRNYDGLELRLTKSISQGWSGSFSYTYSSLWGNYTGLTTTDQTDGGVTGRNSPDTTRAFDEPYYNLGANGKYNDGPLPTDRPNVLKGNVYYQLPWWKRHTTTLGLFQAAYQGSPMSSFIDLLAASSSQPYNATYIWGRGKWVDATTDAAGNITLGAAHDRRTPWFTQTDFNIGHQVKVSEHQSLSFEATSLNIFNQRAVTAYWQGVNSINFASSLRPGPARTYSGAAAYDEVEHAYTPQDYINGPYKYVVKNSQYGTPFLYQNGRTIRLGVRFTF